MRRETGGGVRHCGGSGKSNDLPGTRRWSVVDYPSDGIEIWRPSYIPDRFLSSLPIPVGGGRRGCGTEQRGMDGGKEERAQKQSLAGGFGNAEAFLGTGKRPTPASSCLSLPSPYFEPDPFLELQRSPGHRSSPSVRERLRAPIGASFRSGSRSVALGGIWKPSARCSHFRSFALNADRNATGTSYTRKQRELTRTFNSTQ
jgi:hypothetical protein